MIQKMTTSLVIALLAASCASNDKKDEKNPFDALTVKEVLIEGKTTQSEIVQAFGAPDMTMEDEKKNDVWVYSKHKNESERNGYTAGAVALLPGLWSLAGAGIDGNKGESSSKTVTLTLSFDRKKKLKAYQLTKVRI